MIHHFKKPIGKKHNSPENNLSISKIDHSKCSYEHFEQSDRAFFTKNFFTSDFAMKKCKKVTLKPDFVEKNQFFKNGLKKSLCQLIVFIERNRLRGRSRKMDSSVKTSYICKLKNLLNFGSNFKISEKESSLDFDAAL